MSTSRPNPSDGLADITTNTTTSTSSQQHDPAASLQCCCGREDCAFLKHSSTVLDSVERDVHTAAKLGQALLARHEAYMADAERDRLELNTRIEQLEMDKRELQAENARTVEENRALLDQLENLNNTVHSSDVKIQNLEATLLSSQQAVRRLEGAAARAEEMERQVALLEREQMQLQNNLINTESDARSAMSRWRKAERGISELQEQLERMEKETKDERERHVEAMGRIERQREMEKELNTAAGRLKGAAAAKQLDKGKSSSTVVSHFVKDLLQDNANLQLGIAELREMLANSNDEIQALRENFAHHRPMADVEEENGGNNDSTTSTLRAELEAHDPPDTPTARLSQEFHIHHHYHVAQKAEVKKPKKKRISLAPGIFSPPMASSPSTSPGSQQFRLSSSPAAASAASHSKRDSASTTLSRPPPNRWSTYSEQPSEFASSSVPSSPQSSHRYSMFDRFPEGDVPASPTTSVDPMSPTLKASHFKRPSEATNRSISMPSRLMITPSKPAQGVSHSSATPEAIQEEADIEDIEDESLGLDTPTDNGSVVEELPPTNHGGHHKPSLRRTSSHESIMSLTGGLDIHTLQARPSQMTLRPLGGADAVFTSVTASSTLSRVTTKRSSAVLRDSLAGMRTPSGSATPTRALSPSGSAGERTGGQGKLARWSSWRLFGGGSSSSNSKNAATEDSKANDASDANSTGTGNTGDTGDTSSLTSDATHADANSAETSAAASSKKLDKDKDKDKDKAKERDLHRASGINQPGAIPGFQEYLAAHQRRGAPHKVLPDIVDVDALREGLEG